MVLMIITPIYPPATGGASTYYKRLTKGLLNTGAVEKIIVITERYPKIKCNDLYEDERVVVKRIFPYRAGRDQRMVSQYLLYALQNLLYFKLPKLITEYTPSVVLVHTSFFNYPNLLGVALDCMRMRTKNSFPAFVADARDRLLPETSLDALNRFDSVIACSKNVALHLCKNERVARKVSLIPVMQEKLRPEISEAKALLLNKGIKTNDKYIVYFGLIKQDKGVGLLIQAFRELHNVHPSLRLVLGGLMREPGYFKPLIEETPGIVYLGSVPRNVALGVTAGAALSVNLSPVESMSRSSLEALALGVRAGLPPNVPEYEDNCSDWIIRERTPASISGKLGELLNSEKPPQYDLTVHDEHVVIEAYRTLLASVIDGRKTHTTNRLVNK